MKPRMPAREPDLARHTTDLVIKELSGCVKNVVKYEKDPAELRLRLPGPVRAAALQWRQSLVWELLDVAAGGEVTDADPVASIPKAGETIVADAKLVVVGDPPEPPSYEECAEIAAQADDGIPPQVCLDTYGDEDATVDDPAGHAYREGMPPQPDEQSVRTPPKYGYQCRPGDAERYDVCAGHKAWVEGQREYANCLDSGGTWDIPSQSCVHRND